MSFPILILIMVVLTMSLLLGRRQFDDLLRHLYEHHSTDWERAGKPLGYFWKPDADTTWIEGTQSRKRILWVWMKQTPPWAEGPLQWKMRIVRLSVVFSYLGFALVGVSLIFSQGG